MKHFKSGFTRLLLLAVLVCACIVPASAITRTVTTTADTGAGSLRQVIINSNAGTGGDTIAFDIPNTDAGYNATTGVYTIRPASTLPALTRSVTIDASTQATNQGNSNPGTLGSGGSVGVDGLTLSRIARPEIQIVGTSAINVGLDIQASSVTVRGLSIYGFGSAPNSDGSANIRIGNGTSGTLIERNVLGASATSFSDPGAGARGTGDNIRSVGGDSGTLQNNLIGYAAGKGFGVENASNNWLIENNEIRGNAIGNAFLDGIDLENRSSNNIVRGNLSTQNGGVGVDSYAGGTGNLIQNNTITGNGRGTQNNPETAGVRLFGSNHIVDRNIISGNYGAGVQVTSGASSCTVTRNSIFGNGDVTTISGGATSGQIGIDLQATGENLLAGTAPYVTLNDSSDADTGGNGLLNFPVFTSAIISGGTLTLSGYARPGAAIELFLAAPDPKGYGEGQTYLTTVTEGSSGDSDAGTGSYSGVVNGVDQGSDTTNAFRFAIPIPSGASIGSELTATATVSNTTSEFSGVFPVASGGTVSGFVYLDTNANGQLNAGESGSGQTLFVKLVPASGGNALDVAALDATTGAYSFAGVLDGDYTLVLDDNNSLSDTTSTIPAGYLLIEAPNGTRTLAVSQGATNQNFGLFNGSKLSGRVFRDNGTGSGTPNDGIQNGGEPGINALTVRATSTNGSTTYATTTTNASGNYTLYLPASIGANTQVAITPVLGAATPTGGSAGTTGGTYARATSTVTFAYATGGVDTGVNFGSVGASTLTLDGAATVLAGNSVYYPHVFTASTGGSVSFSDVSAPTPSTVTGWAPTLFLDADNSGTFTSSDTAITGPIIVTAGQQIAILVRETVPSDAPAGARTVDTLTATLTFANASTLTQTLTRTDTTTSAANGLQLTKVVNKTAAKHDDVLTYTVTYRNIASETLSTLRITDLVPAFTTFKAATYGTTPAGLTPGTITAPAVGATGTVTWPFTGSLAPNAQGTITLQVTVQ